MALKTNELNFIHTNRYGMVVVSQNLHEQLIENDYGQVIDRFPAGLILRWLPKGQDEPEVAEIEGKFLDDFDNESELREFIENTSLDNIKI